MVRMDFENFASGVVHLVIGLATALNTTFSPAVPLVSYGEPQSSILVESENLPPEIIESSKTSETFQDLNSITQEEHTKLEMVVRPVEEAVPVSQDVYLYTVLQPSPKLALKPNLDKPENPEIVKEEKTESSTLPTPAPAQAQTPPSSNSDRLFQMVNDYRSKLGLNAFEKDESLCKYARERAPMVNTELASGALHKGFKELNLPYWATENIAAYSSIEENFKFWLSDYIHKKAIESDNKYSCLACEGSSCSQIFTSFLAR